MTVKVDEETLHEFLDTLDPILDQVDQYGYSEEVERLDELREQLLSEKEQEQVGDDVWFDLQYNSDGVSVSKWEDGCWVDGQPMLRDEWWLTWPEVFTLITGIEGHVPEEINSGP
jgi:hypothetical protein